MRVRQFVRKFHKWIGLIASVWLLLLASTGFLLQHSQKWQLDQKYINNAAILKFYGIGEQFIAFKQGNKQLIQLDNQLIQNNKVTIKLEENINSALYHQDYWIIATDTQIIWVDEKGQIIQTLDEIDGLNVPINKIGKQSKNGNQEIIYKSQDQTFNIESELIQTNDATALIEWPKIYTNQNIKEKSIKLSSKDYLSFEQFIFDIHAGITTPSLLNDIAAISLIILSISGIFLFFRKRKRNRP